MDLPVKFLFRAYIQCFVSVTNSAIGIGKALNVFIPT
jgi:hypothetical protein